MHRNASRKSSKTAKPSAATRDAVKAAKPRTAGAESRALGASARIDACISALGDWRGERLAEIRELIHEVDPGVVEDWKWMGTPVWSHDGMYALANAHKDKVKLTFFHGSELRDPAKLFNASRTGRKWRAIDWREGDRIDKPALAALLREAVAYNERHTVPKSRGSRAASKAETSRRHASPGKSSK
jgi:hypothetical protein